jgi:hypothetical protein
MMALMTGLFRDQISCVQMIFPDAIDYVVICRDVMVKRVWASLTNMIKMIAFREILRCGYCANGYDLIKLITDRSRTWPVLQ